MTDYYLLPKILMVGTCQCSMPYLTITNPVTCLAFQQALPIRAKEESCNKLIKEININMNIKKHSILQCMKVGHCGNVRKTVQHATIN